MKSTETVIESLVGARPGPFVDGRWRESASQTFDVANPATGTLLTSVGHATAADADAAVDAANRALPHWAGMPGWQRYEILRSGVEMLRAGQDDLAHLISAESGKPMAEGRAEARNTVRFLEWFSHETMRLPGAVWPGVVDGRDAFVTNEPLGVVAAITPWNFPGFMMACKVGAALAAGCTVVAKPAEQTPLTALAIVRAFDAAGVPPGVLNIVPTGDPAAVGDVLATHRDVACVSFTGSREVGERLMRAAASTIKHVLLELGGNAPVVVLDDADVDRTVAHLIRARYANAGQACVAANRVYVLEPIADEMVARLVDAVQALRVGDPFDDDTDLGPLIDLDAVERIEAQMQAVQAEGATLACGGRRLRETGVSAFIQPAVVTADAADHPASLAEEFFGPVLSVIRCPTEDEAIAQANASNYGLAGYVFAGDREHGVSVARRLRVGSVGVNCALVSEPQLPFGGTRASGLGRERGRIGVEEFLETKTIQVAT